MSSKEFYGVDYGTNIYSCKPCDAYVGTYGATYRALGSLATKELRELRRASHQAFDILWKSGRMDRSGAYAWLSEKMGLPTSKTHIGMFDEKQCKEVLRLITIHNI